MKKVQAGFTLIELVVVITILGILAAFALPKFVGLESSARAAVVQGLEGSLKSAAAMTHALQLAAGSGPTDPVVLPDGSSVNMVNGYPANGSINLLIEDISDFTCGGGVCQINSVATTCAVTYLDSTGANVFPNIDSDTSGC